MSNTKNSKRVFQFTETERELKEFITLFELQLNFSTGEDADNKRLLGNAKAKLKILKGEPLNPLEKFGIALLKLQDALAEKVAAKIHKFGNWELEEKQGEFPGSCSLKFSRAQSSANPTKAVSGNCTIIDGESTDDISILINSPDIPTLSDFCSKERTNISFVEAQAFGEISEFTTEKSPTDEYLNALALYINELFEEVYNFE